MTPGSTVNAKYTGLCAVVWGRKWERKTVTSYEADWLRIPAYTIRVRIEFVQRVYRKK